MRVWLAPSLLTAAVVAGAIAAPRAAEAGACMPCESHATCVEATGDPFAKCVEFSSNPPPCAASRRTCCPGQGCAIGSGGIPSCLGTTCTEVSGGSGEDAGSFLDGTIGDGSPVQPPRDAGDGSAPSDGGPRPDGASGRGDASTSTGTRDASSGGPVTGGGMAVRDDGCQAVSGGSAGAMLAISALGLLVLRRRRS